MGATRYILLLLVLGHAMAQYPPLEAMQALEDYDRCLRKTWRGVVSDAQCLLDYQEAVGKILEADVEAVRTEAMKHLPHPLVQFIQICIRLGLMYTAVWMAAQVFKSLFL